ncbi:MAG: CPBP family intramembrane metalloprotease [Proteobacteria bacterium]|nr:CPBP family intramembrane metalloprotease [Pseudomonadota bacterium]
MQLTKQRVQLESSNKLQNIQSNVSPYIWNFDSFTSDIVQPFQSFWVKQEREQEDKHQIVSTTSNPQLSLNFSGEVLNTFHHSQLIIHSSEDLTGTLSIQAKADLFSDDFYYIYDVALTGKSVSINLNQAWKGLNSDSKNISDFYWNKSANKVSSFVLQFKGEKVIAIESVEIPFSQDYKNNYDQYYKNKSDYTISCDGSIAQDGVPKHNEYNAFVLKQNCWLPSNYMWLKNTLNITYPGSVLLLDGVDLWLGISSHKVNKSYTGIWVLNSVLYLFVVLYLMIVAVIVKKMSFKQEAIKQEPVKQELVQKEKWYKWLVKQMLLKGVKKPIGPYHLILNYAVILVPSLFVLLFMAFIKMPTLEAFKLLPMYFIWAIIQQFVLGYVLAQRIFYSRTQNRLLSSILAAAVFSLLHIPSFHLMIVTFVVGVLWAYAWLLFKRFIPLAISHAVLALMYYYVMSDRFLYSAKTFQWFWE